MSPDCHATSGASMSKRTNVIIFQVALPLLIGVAIYATLRAQPPFSPSIPWETPVFTLSSLPRFLYIFLVFQLPGMLWTFSFLSALNICVKNSLLASMIVLSIIIAYEYLQYLGLLSGTGDIGDIFCSMCAIILYLIVFGGKRNVKKIT